jgi:hypothetical protein
VSIKPAGGEHADAVTDQHQFTQIAGDHHQRFALTGQFAQQGIDVELRTDVDATRVGSSNSIT